MQVFGFDLVVYPEHFDHLKVEGVPKVLICYPSAEDERESNPDRKE